MVKEESMIQPDKQLPLQEETTTIRRGKVGSVDLYEVKESELDILEKGQIADVYFNFSIFFLSLIVSCLTTLATTEKFSKPIFENVFLFTLVISVFASVVFFILWIVNKRGVGRVIRTIKSRIPPDIIISEKEALTIKNESTSGRNYESPPDVPEG